MSDCIIWSGAVSGNGYGAARLNGRQIGAHRKAYIEAYGAIPDGLQVCHTCDTPLCVNPSHLFLGTVKDNAQDKVSKGRQHRPTGDKHPMRKMTARLVKRALLEGWDARRLMVEGGVSETAARFALNGQRWRSVHRELGLAE